MFVTSGHHNPKHGPCGCIARYCEGVAALQMQEPVSVQGSRFTGLADTVGEETSPNGGNSAESESELHDAHCNLHVEAEKG
ncbi:hypothetical protein C8Q74DRAFT_1261898 [Fomes fomentarius]|nr:hypothetical protein C8Q74DRAFT_1261898 [Fomes fomentarius]